MNILYLAHRLPFPPNKGDKIRSYHQVAHLARKHQVWCACFIDHPQDKRHVEALRAICHKVKAIQLDRSQAMLRGLWSLIRGQSATQAAYRNNKMRRTLARWQGKTTFDAVVTFSSSMAPYGLSVDAPRRILDLCDLDSLKWASYAQRFPGIFGRLCAVESKRLAAKECEWIEAFDAAVVCTQAEANELPVPHLRQRLTVIGNGVQPRPVTPLPHSKRIGFVGAMDYPPNIDAVWHFVKDAWPKIREAEPEATFQIVGRGPTQRVTGLNRCPGVEVVGEVGDVNDSLAGFMVSVAPLRIAQGIQNKVLEAMAAARPVVLSSAAARGISGTNGEHYLVADDADTTAQHVISLLRNHQRAERIGQTARSFVEATFDWHRELAKLDELLNSKPTRRPLTPSYRPSPHLTTSKKPETTWIWT